MKLAKIFFLLALCAMFAFADTTFVSGDVSGVWDTSGSPYVATDDIQIPGGDTLKINAGVSVLFADSVVFNIEGVLSDLEAINFRGINDSSYWEVSFFEGDPETIRITACVFRNGVIWYYDYKQIYLIVDYCEFYTTYLIALGIISNSLFTDNSTATGNADYVSCLITKNDQAIYGASWWVMGGGEGVFPSFYYCTITDNEVALKTEYTYFMLGEIELYDCIIYGNADMDSDDVKISNCILGDSLPFDPADSYIVADPLFIDPVGGDYRLKDSSLAIGAGDSSCFLPDFDLYGNPRPNPAGSMPDLGCYENPLAHPAAISEATAKPNGFSLSVFPNPFNSAVRISVGARHAVPVRIEIYDIAGKRVFTESVGAGLKPARAGGSETLPYETVWSPTPFVPSGVYLVRAKIGNSETTKRVVYLK